MNEETFYADTAMAVKAYINQELNLSGQACRFVRAASGPRVLTVWLAVNPHYADKIRGMENELSMASRLDRDQMVRVERGNRGTLAIQIPKPRELCKSIVPANALPRHRGIRPGLGFDAEFRPVSADFGNPLASHLLIPGMTGGGKTNAARLLLWQLVRSNDPDSVKLLLLDVRKRGIGFAPFSHVPHLLHPVVTDEQTAARALAWCAAEIDRRATERYTRPALFVCIDEAQALLQQAAYVKQVSDLVSVGREFNIHVLAMAQDPSADQIGSQAIKRNMGRLVFKATDAQAALIAAGVPGSGAERLTGPGDGLLIDQGGTRRIAVAYLAVSDFEDLPYCEQVGELDLSGMDDPDHVSDQADLGRLEPAHVALALASGRGITWLTRELHIGSGKAARVKEYADALRIELDRLSYTGIPAIPATVDGECNVLEKAEGGYAV